MPHDFRQMIVFQIAYDLALQAYSVLPLLPPEEQKNLGDQLRRCVTSIPLNIAEGSGSNSTKVFFNHLAFAYGSAKELGVILDLCKDLGYIDISTFNRVNDRNETFKAKMHKYLASVEQKLIKKQWHTFFGVKNMYAANKVRAGQSSVESIPSDQ